MKGGTRSSRAMVAAVAVETRRRSKRNKAMAEEEEENTPPPPPAAAVRRPRQPTPDHPPYCWMIGEAIDALGEDGGSEEGAISSFIRAAHPGVPAAHDKFLRHYLAKHVAEGFFACTAPGRYARSTDEAAAGMAPVEPAVAGSSDATRVGPPVVQPKRGRGRPRKDGSSSASPAVKKDGSARSGTPKRRGRPRSAARLAAGDGSVQASSVAAASAVADKNGSQATASKPRRRRRLRKLATSTYVSGEALVTDKEDDGIDAPSTTGKEEGRSLELALVVGDGSATTPTVDNSLCDEASPTMPVDRDQPGELALVTTSDVPVPMLPMDKQDCVSATFAAPERRSQSCDLALVAADEGSVPLLVADEEDGDEAPYAKYKCLRQPRKASPMAIAAQGTAPSSAAGKKARGKTLSATPKAKHLRRQRKLAREATGAYSAPTLVTGNKASNEVSLATLKLTPVTAGGGNGAPSVVPKPHGQPSTLYPLTADEIPDDPSWCLLALPAAAHA